jgi:glycerol-3-phosphate dehydrogenase
MNEAFNERSYFLQSAPYLNYQMNLVLPSESLLKTLLFNFPSACMYHMFYMKFLISSSFSVSLKGPRFFLPHQIIKDFPQAKAIHLMKGVAFNEVQTMDSRMALNALLTSSVDKFVPGMKGATLANHVVFKSFSKDESGKICGANLYDTI